MKRRFFKRVCAWSLAVAVCLGNGVSVGAVSVEKSVGSIGAGSGAVLMTSTDPGVSGDIAIDATNFPDDNFRNYISTEIDGQMLDSDIPDGKLSAAEIAKVENIYVVKAGISSLEGIKYFTGLTELYCSGNNLTALDVSGMTALQTVDCSNNKLAGLDVSGMIALTSLNCSSNQLDALNLSGLTGLKTLSCAKNKLTSLDISSLAALETLNCSYNDLTTLTMGTLPLTRLTGLNCSENDFTSLDVGSLTGLTSLDCSSNQLRALDVSKLTELMILLCNNNMDMASLNVTGLTSLNTLDCYDCDLSSLDVSTLTNLFELNCYSNKLTTLDLSNLSNLATLNCSSNGLVNLKLTGLTNLSILKCSLCKLTALDLSGLTGLTELDCSNNNLKELSLSDLTELVQLKCYGNQLTSLDVSAAKKMEHLYCDNNNITSLDITNLTGLYTLQCDDVSLSGLDLSENTSLRSVNIYIRGVRQYDLSKVPGLDTTKVAALEITDGLVTGTVLTINEDADEATFNYDCYDADAGYPNYVYFTIAYLEPKEDDPGENQDPEVPEHHYSDAWTVDVAPTCIQKGSKSHHCTDAGCDSKTDVTEIPAVGHTSTVQTTPATMTTDGSIVKKCSVCGTAEDTQVISHIDKVTLSKTSYTYNGKAQKPKVTVKDSQGVTLPADCYDVQYSSGCKVVGKYTVKVTFKGNYSGNTSLTYTICPKATSFSKVTAKKKGFALQWKKITTQTTGYEIQYSTSKNFKKASKITVKKNKTTEKTVTKLKAKKTYYVRVRTYKTVKVNGKNQNIYSGWSKVKTVKTK